MAQIQKNQIDALNAQLIVTVTPEDYKKKYQKELEKMRQKATIKGFRKGFTPKVIVEKNYGPSLFMDIIDHAVREDLSKFITEENLALLGQPIPSSDQDKIVVDHNKEVDYIFKFDIGMIPEFQLAGLESSTTVKKFKVDIAPEIVEEELNKALSQVGDRTNPTSNFQEKDLIHFKYEELENGELKEEGIANESVIILEEVGDILKGKLSAAQIGDTLDINPSDLSSKENNETFLRKYVLKIEGDNPTPSQIRITLTMATRTEKGSMTKESFDKIFGLGLVEDADQARSTMAGEIRMSFAPQVNALMYRDMQDMLMEKNKFDLPEAFLKRWMKSQNEGVSDEAIEKEFNMFSKNLKWTLIRDKIAEENEVKVTKEDIIDALERRVYGYFGGNPNIDPSIVTNVAERMYGEEKTREEVALQILDDKVFQAVEGKISIAEENISVDGLKEAIKSAQASAQSARGENHDHNHDHDHDHNHEHNH
jgi:trigger factor